MRPTAAQRPRGPATLADLLARAEAEEKQEASKPPATDSDGPASPAETPKPTEPEASNDGEASPPESTAPEPEPPAPPPAKAPVPNAKALAQATDQLRADLQSDLQEADSPEKRSALTQELLEMGEKSADAPQRRYAYFELAREQAGRVGDPQLIEQAVERLARHFEVNALYLQAETMATAWRSDYSIPHRAALFQQSKDVLKSAVAAKNFAAANQAMRVVMAGARATRDYRLIRELEELQRDIRTAEADAGQ